MQKRIRWGVIGAGGFADIRIAPAINQCRNACLQAVMVRDMDRANALARKHAAAEAYSNIPELLVSPNVDAVYICTPVDLHSEHVIAVAQAGKHAFVEKPMAGSVGECLQMIEACQSHGVHLGVAYMMRYRSQCQEAKRLIVEGRLGDLVTGRAQNCFWYPEIEDSWRQNQSRGGGGVLFDVGSHAIDTLRFLMGEVRLVQGLTGSKHFAYPVEDTAQALLKFENEALGMIDCSWAIPNREYPLELYGTKGSLLITNGLGPLSATQIRLLTSEGALEIPLQETNAYIAEFEAYSQAILEERAPEVDGWEGLRITEILLAIYRSAKNGEPLPLPRRKL